MLVGVFVMLQVIVLCCEQVFVEMLVVILNFDEVELISVIIFDGGEEVIDLIVNVVVVIEVVEVEVLLVVISVLVKFFI